MLKIVWFLIIMHSTPKLLETIATFSSIQYHPSLANTSFTMSIKWTRMSIQYKHLINAWPISFRNIPWIIRRMFIAMKGTLTFLSSIYLCVFLPIPLLYSSMLCQVALSTWDVYVAGFIIAYLIRFFNKNQIVMCSIPTFYSDI